ncbi:MAG: hypothetical protein C4K58_01905 [Flavobacteriaceae bacterium]|nr:MAG: hypothetical protein C4K58_01905 [Flavobacteriaceae bacterium]
MKKLSLLLAGFLLMGTASAQNNSSSELDDLIKVGIQAGIPVSDAKDISSAALGINISYQHLINTNVGIGFATGYTNYFGDDTTKTETGLAGLTSQTIKTKNDDFGIIPIAALFRYYPDNTGFYFGADAGYGLLINGGKGSIETTDTSPIGTTTTEKDFDNSEKLDAGGFYLRPEIGYHNNDWNFFGYYQNTFMSDNSISSLGLGLSYNIPL